MTTELEQREDILVSLNRQELHSLLDLDPVRDSTDSSARLDIRLSRIPRTAVPARTGAADGSAPDNAALPDESFIRELFAHEDELFSWLATDPENGKAFIADPLAAFKTATSASAQFLERMTSMGEGDPDQPSFQAGEDLPSPHTEASRPGARTAGAGASSKSDLSAGWQAIVATRRSCVNETLSSLFEAGAIPREIESAFTLIGKDYVAHARIASAPEIIDGEAGRVTLKVALTGEIAPGGGESKLAMKLRGEVELTVDLKRIQASVKKGENETEKEFLLEVDLVSGAFFDAIDLSHLEVFALGRRMALPDGLGPQLLDMMNQAVGQISSPLQFLIPKPLPVLLTGLVVRFTYTKVPGDAGKDFLSILFGLADDMGSFDLSPAIIGEQADADTAFIFGNRSLMETIKAGLSDVDGGSEYEFEVNDAYPAHVSNARTVKFPDAPKVWLKIRRRAVQVFVDGKLNINVTVSYMNLLTFGVYHRVEGTLTTSFESDNGNIRLTFVGEVRVPSTFLITPLGPFFRKAIAKRIKKLIESQVDGKMEALIFVPGFDVSGLSTPSYLQISGKVNRHKQRLSG